MPRTDRPGDMHRELRVERGANRHAEGSALVRLGHTQVLVTVSVESRVPPHLRGKKTGWLTAEYDMLPRATHDRVPRERIMQGGRRQEIQRLMGRALRAAVNLDLFREKTLYVDADVLQADGGTRVASILGAYAALFDLSDRMIRAGKLSEWPLRFEVGAVSVGVVDGELCVDLDFLEDQRATADLNVVGTGDGMLLEVQGGAEGEPIDPEVFARMVTVGLSGVRSLLASMNAQL